MKEHHLSVTTLEEHEPNREFVGRNFNGGEIIQLVLRARSGRWLPFGAVQMVMMHELAHCVQMNHSRAFWRVRNLYADQIRALWRRGYTGEGMWGRGAMLASGELEDGGAWAAGGEGPEQLCGGAFRSRRGRGRKRRRRKGDGEGAGQDGLSYQERKQRRIERKFGKNGVALGADDAVKARLEKGKRTQAAPRVAGSNRGRDLRAAAALARFEQQKQEVEEDKQEQGGDEESVGGESASSDESDYEYTDPLGGEDAVDVNGNKMLDAKGNRMVKVCEDENPEDEDAANETKEIQTSIRQYLNPSHHGNHDSHSANTNPKVEVEPSSSRQGSNHMSSRNGPLASTQDRRTTDANHAPGLIEMEPAQPSILAASTSDTDVNPDAVASTSKKTPSVVTRDKTCAICSFGNEPYAVTCGMCSHVLSAADVPGTWKCRSVPCRNSEYLNAGDCGACGVCGQRKGGDL